MRQDGFFTPAELDAVVRFYDREPDAPPTPLHRLPALAADLGVGEVLVKDESARFGLPAFKILGTRYAVARLLTETRPQGLTAATSGNHGRAVAHAARRAGLPARIYVPAGTARSRLDDLRDEGATVIDTGGDYDAAVRIMADEAGRLGWTIVSDAGWTGYETVPRWIMAGYTRLLDEAARDWGSAPPDVVVVQAGVGSLAAAVAGGLACRFENRRPKVVVVEPEGAACVAASIAAGRRQTLPRVGPTTMAGLRCGEVSLSAWPALVNHTDAAIGITDADTAEAMDRLAHPGGGDPRIDAGPSGAAGLAGLVVLLRAPSLARTRAALGLGRTSRVLAINTEGPLVR